MDSSTVALAKARTAAREAGIADRCLFGDTFDIERLPLSAVGIAVRVLPHDPSLTPPRRGRRRTSCAPPRA